MMIIQYPQRRFSSVGRASALQAEGQRFEPVNLHHFFADLAQLVEQLTCNQQVGGSIPLVGTSGEVAKWLNAADCNSVLYEFDGSNPSLPTIFIGIQPRGKATDFDSVISLVRIQLSQPSFFDSLAQMAEHLTFNQRVRGSNPLRVTILCGCSSMVELQPSKLTTWVRFPSPAPTYEQVNLRIDFFCTCKLFF